MVNKLILMCCAVFFLSMLSSTRVEATVSSTCQTPKVLDQPTGLAYDSVHGTVWVAMLSNNTVNEYDQSCNLIRSVTTGTNPLGVVFDGQNIWVSNYGSNSVTEVNTTTGGVIATVGVGTNPRGLVTDGTYIYVANYTNNTVTKIARSNGAVVLTCSVGAGPYFLTYNSFDGNLYVPNRNSNTVTVLPRSSCTPVRTVSTDTEPQFTTVDGSGNVWVTCYTNKMVDEISTGGAVLRHVTLPDDGPTGITFDPIEGLIWGCTWSGYVYSIDPTTGLVGNVTYRGGAGHGHYDIIWPGILNRFWATDDQGGQVNYLLHS